MQTYQVEYGTSASIPFVLYDPTGATILSTVFFQYGDILISVDGSNPVSGTNLPTNPINSFNLILTSAETTCRQALFTLIDTTSTKVWLDTSFVVETYGTSASYHPNIGNFGPTIDGIGLETLLADLAASTYGRITKSNDLYTYYGQNGEVRFMLSAGQGGRGRIL